MTMYVVPLVTVTPAMLISSTAPEPGTGETAWDPTANYVLGQEVISLTSHHIYQNTIAGVDATLPENNPLRWFDLGPCNRWAMFDTKKNTPTTAASPLTVVIAPNQRVDSLGLIGMTGATSAEISMTSGGVVVYDVVRNLNKRIVSTSYNYCFDPFGTQGDIVEFDLPPYSGGVITVTLHSDYGQLSCEHLVIGTKIYIGDVQYEAESDVANYSTVTRDTDGEATFVPVPNEPLTTSTLWIDKSRVDQIRDLRKALNAQVALWAGLDDDTDDYFGSLLTLAFYHQFTINLKYPDFAVLSLKLEGI